VGAAEGTDVYHGDRSLRDELDAVFRTATADEWLERFVAWDVPCGLVEQPDDLAEFGHTTARGLLERDWHGSVPNVLSPIRWMDTGTRPGSGASPCSEIGADTDDVLARWLGEDRQHQAAQS